VSEDTRPEGTPRFGMAIDLDRCNGCGACVVACAVENNVSVPPESAGVRKSLTWLRVEAVRDGKRRAHPDVVYLPLPCMQCDREPPCATVCPQNAVQLDPQSGIVGQIHERCLGCRYCVAACPYHARVFNWWDPEWPDGMQEALNPDVHTRTRGVVEKCNFCHARWQAAREAAAAQGRRDLAPGEYVPACVEACPAGAIVFGDLADPTSDVAQLAASPRAFRLLETLGTEPKVYYLSDRDWVVALGNEPKVTAEEVEAS